MKFLITGGNGFIGSHIVEKLSKEHKVAVLDNNDTYGIMSQVELQKLHKWRQRNWTWKNISTIQGDVLNRLNCLQAFSHHPDIVIHLATYPRAKIVNDDPIVGVPKIINGTTNLLWHCSKFNVSKFKVVKFKIVKFKV